MKSKKREKNLLTEVELEFMKTLWELGEGTVRDVMAKLPPSRELAYTSVSTIMRILEQKNFLKSRKEGISYIYTPMITKSYYESLSLNHFVKDLFKNEPVSLVTKLLDDNHMSQEELLEIKEFIETKLEK